MKVKKSERAFSLKEGSKEGVYKATVVVAGLQHTTIPTQFQLG